MTIQVKLSAVYARGVADAILEGRAQALTELTEQVEAAAA